MYVFIIYEVQTSDIHIIKDILNSPKIELISWIKSFQLNWFFHTCMMFHALIWQVYLPVCLSHSANAPLTARVPRMELIYRLVERLWMPQCFAIGPVISCLFERIKEDWIVNSTAIHEVLLSQMENTTDETFYRSVYWKNWNLTIPEK